MAEAPRLKEDLNSNPMAAAAEMAAVVADQRLETVAEP